MSESQPQAPQGEFRCPQCGCNKLYDDRLEDGQLRCASLKCTWTGTWSDVLAARQGEEQSPAIETWLLTGEDEDGEFYASKVWVDPECAEDDAEEIGGVIVPVVRKSALDKVKQQLAEAREQLEIAQDRISVLIKTQPPHENVIEAADRAADEAVRKLENAGRAITKDERNIIQAACEDACQEWRAHFNFGCELREECERENNDLREQLAAVTAELDRLQRFVDAVLKFDEEGQHVVHLMLHPLCAAWRTKTDHSPAAAAEAERVRRLEAVATEARELMESIRLGCAGNIEWRLAKALSALDAAKGGAT